MVLCEQELRDAGQRPGVDIITATLAAVSLRLDTVVRASPHLERAISELEDELQRVQAALARNRRQMEAVRSAEETGVAREVAELCLSHAVGNKVEQAYARSDLYRRRCRVMEAWSAYVTGGGSDWEGIPGVLNPVFGPP